MKKIFFLVLILGTSVSAFCQSTQNGVVKEYNGAKKKAPLAGVELVVNNAGSHVSDRNGKFVLSFRTLKPGDKVELRKIEKNGYEVFNKDALEAWRIANDGSEFMIVLCKSSRFKALKDQYNAVASKSYAEQQKKDEEKLATLLKEGQIQQTEYEQKLQDLKHHYDEQLENLDNYIDHFARIDLETLSKEEQKIIEMVQAGKIEDAIAAYENMHLEEQYAKAVENIHIAGQAISQLEQVKQSNQAAREDTYDAIKRMNDARRLQGGEENFRKIGESLKTLADLDTTNTDIVKEYAIFATDQNNFTEAIRYYQIIIRHSPNDTVLIGKAYNDLGSLFSSIGQYKDSEDSHKKALEIQRSICKKDSTRLNLERLARYQMNYGNVCCYTNNCPAADSAFQDARNFYLQNPEEYTIGLIETSSNLGNLYTRMKEYDKAAEAYEMAFVYIHKSDDSSSEQGKRRLAMISTNYGSMEFYHGKYDKAERYLLQAYDYFKELMRFNPSAYSLSTARTCQFIGMLYQETEDYEKCITYYNQALNILLSIYEREPLSVREDIIYQYVNTAVLYMAMKDYDKAYESLIKCKVLSAPVMKEYPHVIPFKECELDYQIVKSLYLGGRIEEALSVIEKEIIEHPDYPLFLDKKGCIYLDMGNTEIAKECLKTLIQMDPDFVEKFGEDSELYQRLKDIL